MLSLVVTYMQRCRSVGESERDEQEGVITWFGYNSRITKRYTNTQQETAAVQHRTVPTTDTEMTLYKIL